MNNDYNDVKAFSIIAISIKILSDTYQCVYIHSSDSGYIKARDVATFNWTRYPSVDSWIVKDGRMLE